MAAASQMKASDIVNAASDALDDNDPAFTRYSESLLRSYVEDGQRMICILKPGTYTKHHSIKLAPGVLQVIPDTSHSFIEVIRNRGADGSALGPGVTFFNKRDLDLHDRSWMVATGVEEIEEFTFEESDPYHFWVNPPVIDDVAKPVFAEIHCNEVPPTVESADADLVLNTIFYQPLYDYVMYRALSTADEAGDDMKAQEHASNAMQSLGIKTGVDKRTFHRDTKNKAG